MPDVYATIHEVAPEVQQRLADVLALGGLQRFRRVERGVAALLDDLSRLREDRLGNSQADRLGGRLIDDQLNVGRLLDR
jgi:hypothetical protein